MAQRGEPRQGGGAGETSAPRPSDSKSHALHIVTGADDSVSSPLSVTSPTPHTDQAPQPQPEGQGPAFNASSDCWLLSGPSAAGALSATLKAADASSGAFSHVRELSVSECPELADSDLDAVLGRLTSLQSLTLSGLPAITVGGLQHLPSSLRSLAVTECPQITIKAISHISECRALEDLSFSPSGPPQLPPSGSPVPETPLTPCASLAKLAEGCPKLRTLCLHGPAIGDAQMRRLPLFTNLKRLRLLNTTSVSAMGLRHIWFCCGLQVVELKGFRVRSQGLLGISGCENLTHICLLGTKAISANSLGRLAECLGVKHLAVGISLDGVNVGPSVAVSANPNSTAHAASTLSSVSSAAGLRYTFSSSSLNRQAEPDPADPPSASRSESESATAAATPAPSRPAAPAAPASAADAFGVLHRLPRLELLEIYQPVAEGPCRELLACPRLSQLTISPKCLTEQSLAVLRSSQSFAVELTQSPLACCPVCSQRGTS